MRVRFLTRNSEQSGVLKKRIWNDDCSIFIGAIYNVHLLLLSTV